jgi:CheY-like chemotaxis protein/HPt (histidine-containing phosphotransfer) domain-containing protein
MHHLSAAVDPVADVLATGGGGPSTVKPGAGLRGARVLLVDDSDVVRDVTRTLLEDAGFDVDEAHDGAIAVRMMQEHSARYALILMDVQMPVLDGLAATRLIRADLGERAPPVIALTASATAQEKLSCREAGLCDHVAKPVDPDQLAAVLNRWLAPSQRTGGVQSASGTATAVNVAPPQMLPDVPGFDRESGLRSVGGNLQHLRSLLARFGASYVNVAAELRQHMTAGNYLEARRVAHTLRGAAATLGGMRIAQSAERVEQAMQQRCEPAPGASSAGSSFAANPAELAELPELAEVDLALQQALPMLRSLSEPLVPAESGAASRAPMPPSAAAEFEALRQLLAGSCYAARKAFALLRDKLGANDADWQAAGAAVDTLDFQQALARLDARYPPNESNHV